MVERKSLGFTPPDRSEMRERIRQAVARGLTDEELIEQKASFIFGNAPVGSRITKESARYAATHVRLTRGPGDQNE